MRARAQRVGIWLVVVTIYWLAWSVGWPLLRGEPGSTDEPSVWLDEEYGVVCYLRGDQMQCLYIPDFEAETAIGDDMRLAAKS